MNAEAKDDFVLANVLPPTALNDQHIPTSINVPHEDPDFTDVMEKVAGGKSRRIVVYCASFDCDASSRTTSLLARYR